MFRILSLLTLMLIAFDANAYIQPKSITTPKGIKAWFYEDKTSSVISMSFFIKAGGDAEEKGHEGIISLMTGLMLRGAGDYDREAFEETILDNAIKMNFSNSDDGIQGELTTLVDNKAKAFELMSLVINKPRFESKELALVRDENLSNLANYENQPDYIGALALGELMYPNNYYGHNFIGTKQSLQSIKLPSIKKLHAKVFAKDGLIIGISGNITEEEAIKMIDKVFGNLPEKSGLKPVVEIQPNSKATTKKISHPAPQASIFFAQPGIKMTDPDFIRASVMMYILGSGSVSRLNDAIREKRGLAYTVVAKLDPYLYSGIIYGNCGTKRENATESVELIKKEWQRMRDSGPTDKELEDAKKFLIGSYPLRFISALNISSMLVMYQMLGKDVDFIKKRDGIIQSLTIQDIKDISKKLLKPEDLTFVIVGDTGQKSEGVEGPAPIVSAVPVGGQGILH